MDELIKTFKQNDGTVAVDGRDLHEFLEVETPYTQWFERMIAYGFTENVDFTGLSQKSEKPQGGRPIVDHAMSLDMAKEVSMIQRTEKGKRARQYFIAMEKRAKQSSLPLTTKEQIRLLAKGTDENNQRLDKAEDRLDYLENDQKLDPSEYGYLNTQVSSMVRRYTESHHLILNSKQRQRLYKDIGGGIKQIANVQTRSQIREGDFDKVLRYIDDWVPSTATVQIISQMEGEAVGQTGLEI